MDAVNYALNVPLTQEIAANCGDYRLNPDALRTVTLQDTAKQMAADH